MAVNMPLIDLSQQAGRIATRVGPWAGRVMERWMALDPDKVPLLNKLPPEQRQSGLIVSMVVSLATAAALTLWYTIEVGNRAEYIEISTRLQMQSQRYTKTAQQAVLGNKTAFKQLEESRKDFAEGIDALINGDASLPASPGYMQEDLAEVNKRWATSQKNIKSLVAQEALLVSLARALGDINQRNPELLDVTEQFIALLPESAKKQLAFANQQSLWTQRMAKNANALLSSDRINAETAYQLIQDVRTFRDVLTGLQQGSSTLGVMAVTDPDARDKLAELNEVFTLFEKQVGDITKNMAQLVEAKRAARELFDDSEPLLNLMGKVTERYQGMNFVFSLSLAAVAALFALASLLVLGALIVREARRRADDAAQENRRNQDAILRLLNEMGDLAGGDLTVEATVTEDITGAIADSVNFAIEELRTLVSGINRASDEVTRATAEARATADEMLNMADRQSRQVSETTEAVGQMSSSIVEVSQNAAESALVAQQSLAAARKGSVSVRDAIAGMNFIRDQIQETSKRIKRLGESSQQIGEIVDLISDMTEQTNVLALNAAIQAAAAGEAGRGFTVVAEEVQKLAERSAGATRRISVLVKTIQSDTKDAVNAMETSTQGVVEGAVRSDAVGRSLMEIESVSEQLARLIQNISDSTQEQAKTAERITGNMRDILGLTDKATDSSRRSAESVGQLTVLSDDLKVSVAGFKL